MARTFSLVTNASLADEVRIRETIPSWLRTFGDRLAEIVIVVDEQRPSGRIAALHQTSGTLRDLFAEIARLEALDPRIRHLVLGSRTELAPIARRWFRRGIPMRCQGGTPIMAFVQAFEAARTPLVLRADCDMLFLDHGWLDVAMRELEAGNSDLLEPPRLESGPTCVSSRALFVNMGKLRERLPIRAHKLDLLRRLHRRLRGRATWLAFEQILDRERVRGHLRHRVLDGSLGYSMHVVSRRDAQQPHFPGVVQAFEQGELPEAQRGDWNFNPGAWLPSGAGVRS